MTGARSADEKDRIFDGVVLVCDFCRKARIDHSERTTEAKLRAAVDAKAAEAGWRIDSNLALCPKCQTEGSN